MYIIITMIVIIILAIFLILFYKKKSYDISTLKSFHYYNGSSGHALEFNGVKHNNLITIRFTEFRGGEHNLLQFVITFEDFKNILNLTKNENCKKHTYEYQCGDANGCSYNSFIVKYDNERKNVCYEVNENIDNFFKNLNNYYLKLDFSNLNEIERNNINLKELLEDIDSVKNNNTIINARSEKNEDDIIQYNGQGYTIKYSYKDHKSLYMIFCNEKQIMQFEV